MGKALKAAGVEAARLFEARVRDLGDWRGRTLAHVRSVIEAADPGAELEWKWNVPVWTHEGILCTGEVYKTVVKLTFARGALLPDPKRLFNSSLEGKTRRAIDIREGDLLNEPALKALLRAAVAANLEGRSRPTAKRGGRR